MIDLGAERARRRAEWSERVARLWPDMKPKDPKNPIGEGASVLDDPLLWEDSIYALEANIQEAAKGLGLWQSRAQGLSAGEDDEAKWERELVFSQVSRYKAEQAHWREYMAKHLRYIAEHPGCDTISIFKRS